MIGGCRAAALTGFTCALLVAGLSPAAGLQKAATLGNSASPSTADCPSPLRLPHSPMRRIAWAPGLWARVWQFSPTGHRRDRVRISVAFGARGTGELRPEALPPDLLDPQVIAREPSIAAVLNGDYFEEVAGGGVPIGAVVVNREVVFAPRGWTRVVAVGSSGMLRTTHAAVSGGISSRGSEYAVAAVNDPLLLRDDIVLFTSRWQQAAVPRGSHAVVVVKGHVKRIAGPSARVAVPRDGYVLATKSSRLLAGLSKGAKVTFDVRAVAKDRRSLVNASGHGGSVMRDGRVAELCSEYENLLRPRSSLAWNDRGDVWLLTSSSGRPDPPDGLRVGGSTKRQLAQVARSLGATEAVILDGGGSVGLFVHKGRKVNRLDLSAGAYVRPIPVVWTLSR